MQIGSRINLIKHDIARLFVGKAKEVLLQKQIKIDINDFSSNSKSTPPQFPFFGSTNIGKSSLLKAVLKTDSLSQNASKLPQASRKTGYTKTVNSYTVGNFMRLVDTPGYGFRSTFQQGQLIESYLTSERANIARSYLLIHPLKMVTENDLYALNILRNHDIPVTYVVTQCDKLHKQFRIEGAMEDMLEKFEEQICEPIDDNIMFTSSTINVGISDLRAELYLQAKSHEAKMKGIEPEVDV